MKSLYAAIIVATLGFATVGCPDTKTTETTPTPDAATAEFDAAAEAEISADNAEEAADTLLGEIEADLAAQ